MTYLPNEIIISIGERIDAVCDLNAFARASRRFLQCVDPLLYSRTDYSLEEKEDFPLESGEIPSLALRRAVRRGLVPTVRKALNQNSQGLDAVLWIATDNYNEDILTMLISVYDVQRYGMMLLHHILEATAFEGDVAVLRIVLGSGKIDPWHNMVLPVLLEKAVRGEMVDNARYLLSLGTFDLNYRSHYGQTPLSVAATNGSLQLMHMLLETGRVEIEALNENGETPLQSAVYWRQASTTKALLSTGQVDVNRRAPNGTGPPLCAAAVHGDVSIVKMLLGVDGIDINIPNVDGLTPLMLAASKGHATVVEMLLARDDVQVEARERTTNATALILAASMDHDTVVEMLLAHPGVEVDGRDDDHWSPLMYAAARGYEPLVEMLLRTGKVDINARDRHGRTPMSQAKSNGQFAIYSLMMDYQAGGADLDNKL